MRSGVHSCSLGFVNIVLSYLMIVKSSKPCALDCCSLCGDALTNKQQGDFPVNVDTLLIHLLCGLKLV